MSKGVSPLFAVIVIVVALVLGGLWFMVRYRAHEAREAQIVQTLQQQAEQAQFGLKLVGVTSHPDSVSSLLVDRPAPPPEPVRQLELSPVAQPREDEWQQNLLVRGVCRSGMVVHNDGNVVVLGDVNPGAEITATGDIVVFGKLRGLAHAGMKGASNATIIAVSIESARLKIGDLMTVVETRGGEARWQGGTQMAFVKDGCIIVEPFDPRSMQLEEV